MPRLFRWIVFFLGLASPFVNAFNLAPYKWPQPSTSFYVDIPGDPAWNSAFKAAMKDWGEAGFTFYVVSNSYSDPCGGAENSNDKNGVGFASTICGVDFGDSTLAITTTWYIGSDIVEADIVFNSNEDWDVYSGPLQFYASDFRRVALHELGHVLGLKHEDDLQSIMSSYSSDLETLQADDYQAVSLLYGIYISDIDSDGIADEKDNCSVIQNTNQLDTDKDGKGDVCDSTPDPYKKILYSSAGQDGWLLESAENSNKGGKKIYAGTTLILGDSANNQQYRTLLHFNTSAIPDNAVIIKATLSLKKYSETGSVSSLGSVVADMRQKYFGSSSILLTSDFQAPAGKSAVATLKGGTSSFSGVINTSGRAYISKTAATQFRLRFSKDDNNDKGSDYVRFYSGDIKTTNLKPSLTVEYYLR